MLRRNPTMARKERIRRTGISWLDPAWVVFPSGNGGTMRALHEGRMCVR
jgi:threonine synthase